MLDRTEINVAYQFSNSYAKYAGVSIFSLMTNKPPDTFVNVYLLTVEQLSVDEIERFRTVIENNNGEMHIIRTGTVEKKLQQYNLQSFHGSIATYYKFFINELIPDSVDKILYIDSDTVVVGDITGLCTKEMKKPMEMAFDSVTMCYLSPDNKKLFNMSPHYNAGVILFNLNMWRKGQYQRKLLEFLKTNKEVMMDADQGIINKVFGGDIELFSLKYNLQPIHFAIPDTVIFDRYNGKDYYSRDEVKAARDSPTIIHMLQLFGDRPWVLKSIHPNNEIYDQYWIRSPWSGYPKIKNKKSLIYFLEKVAYKVLPKKLFYKLFTRAFNRSWVKEYMSKNKGLS